jgi:hypothetical protein
MANITSTPWTARLLRSPLGAVCASIATLTLITGCGGSESDGGKKSDVASIDGRGKTGSAEKTATAPAAEGVQIRLDSSEEEKRLIQNGWTTCLKKNGVPTYSKKGNGLDPTGGEWVFPDFKSPAMRGADEACKAKKPIQPPELDKNKNPDYEDDFRKQIQCMDKRGVKVNVRPDGYSYVGTPPPDYIKIEHECELEAFGG